MCALVTCTLSHEWEEHDTFQGFYPDLQTRLPERVIIQANSRLMLCRRKYLNVSCQYLHVFEWKTHLSSVDNIPLVNYRWYIITLLHQSYHLFVFNYFFTEVILITIVPVWSQSLSNGCIDLALFWHLKKIHNKASNLNIQRDSFF